MQSSNGAVTGSVRWLLQLEGATALAVATMLYARTGASWWLFAALFFVPDVAMLGYLAGPRIGAACYNAFHWYTVPLALWAAGPASWQPVALIWIGHIGFDRMFRYGLKYPTAFKATHLGPTGAMTGGA